MLKLISSEQASAIVKSLVKAATEDLEAMTQNAYKFISIASGFIAHYNCDGFIHHYGTPENLADKILDLQPHNQWDNFYPGEDDYEYMMQKRHIYNSACEGIKNYRSQIQIGKDFKDKDYKITVTIHANGKDAKSAWNKAMKGQIINWPKGTEINWEDAR